MSNRNVIPAAVVEWSPTQVSWVDANHQLRTAATLDEAAPSLPGREVIIAVSRRSAFIRASRVPNASKGDVHRILQVQIGQLFPVPANELAFDFHLTSDVNSEGRMAVIAAMRSSDLRALQAQAKSAGLRILRTVPAALGSPILAHTLGHDTAAVVHRTAEGLAIDLVVGGELRYSRIAVMPSASIGIDAEVSRTFAAAILNCSPTIAAGALALPDAQASTDTWAIETLAGAHVDINIRTPEEIAAAERSGETQKLRVGVALFAVAAVFLGWQAWRYSSASKAVADKLSVENKSRAALQKTADEWTGKANSATQVKNTLTLAFHPAQPLSDVLTLATNAAPKGIWLTALSLDRGKALTLRGTSMGGNAIADYQTALLSFQEDGKKRFRDVKLVFQNNADVEKNPVVQFSVSGFPVGNLPLTDLNAKGGQKQ